MMKITFTFAFLILSLTFISSISLPLLYIVQSNFPADINVVNLETGKTVQLKGLPGNENFLGITQSSNYGFQLLTQENNQINLYNYSVASNSLEVIIKDYPVKDQINIDFQQIGVNSLTNQFLLLLGGNSNNEVTVYNLDFEPSGKFSQNEIDLQFYNPQQVTLPTGCYDTNNAYYYVYYLDSSSQQPTIAMIDMSINRVDQVQPVKNINASEPVNLFFSNRQAYAVQYDQGQSKYNLYTISSSNLRFKLVYSIETQFFTVSQNNIYFASNEEYIAFAVGLPGNKVQYVLVDLTNFKEVYTSPEVPSSELYLYYLALGGFNYNY